jgi:1,2-diacylglycerol 3-alpha-glucosyltransferase
MEDTKGEKKRLKIAIVIDSYDECKNGAAISTKRFVNLLSRDHDVFLITTGHPAPRRTLMPKFYPPIVRNVMKKMKTPLAFPINSRIRKVLREVDIIHVQFPFFLAIQSVKIARELHIPVVTTFHIQAEHLAMNAGINAKWFITGCYRIWLDYIYNPSDLVICPSQFAEDELKSFGLTSPSKVISNGILPGYRPEKLVRQDEWKEKFIILSVGRFAPEKRHQLIIEAIQKSRFRDKIQLILIGEGPMKEKLEKLGGVLTNKPIILSLNQEELIYYYNISDLYIHAASIEIEGMTILEAMGCGLPLLVAESKKSAAKQFALDQKSLFVSDDVTDLIQKMDYWIDNPVLLKAAKKDYYEFAAKYRIEHSYQLLVDQYLKLVNGNHHNGTDILKAR